MKNDAVTWLDLRPDDLALARDFIRSLHEEGVIDELGFLGLQERFSDLLHPATTTLMRSARYFYFVAGIYRALERQQVRSKDVVQLARQKQDELRNILAVTEPVGVIGRDAGISLRQFPSSIYWAGLRKLGMFKFMLSESAYCERFDDIRLSRKGYQDDDKTVQEVERLDYWDPELPPARFLDPEMRVKPGQTFKLTKSEAQDLHSRFATKFPDSLLTHMLANRLVGMDWPWDCPRLPRQLKHWLEHARQLSLFVRGVTLQYYSLLLEEQGRLGLSAGAGLVEPVFDQWWAEARRSLIKWSTAELASVRTVSSAIRPGSRGDLWFIDAWREQFVSASTARSLLGNAKARELIKERERRVKPTKSRLKYEKHLRQWKYSRVSEGVYQFDYRHRIGSRFVSEILASVGE